MGTVVNPGNRPWYTSASGITITGTTKTYNTYADMLREQYPGKLAWVIDATGDPTVDKGSALYTWKAISKTWEKIYETESMDGGGGISVQNFVGWVASPEQLKSMYPEAKDGWYAIVGTTDTIWVWDSDTNTWKDASAIGGQIMWSQIVDPPSSVPISFVSGLQDALDLRVLTSTLEEFYPKKVDLKSVAFTGSYNDLTDLPDLENIETRLSTVESNVSNLELSVEKLSEYLDALTVDQLPGIDKYQKITDSIEWSRITGFPSDQYALKSYVDQNFSKIDHTHSQYILKTEVESLYATKQELETEIQSLATVYAPVNHTHSMDDIVGYIDNIPKYMQFVRPVEEQDLFLKVDIYSDPTLETLVKSIDGRTEEGRLAMTYYNGTSYVAAPKLGIPADGKGRLTAVNVGDIEAAGPIYIVATWQNTVASFSVSTATMYPAFTPSDMYSVGMYWRSLGN